MARVSARLREWAEQQGWTIMGDRVCGDYAGYTFTAFDGQGFKAFALLVPAWSESDREGVKHFLKENRKPLRLKDFKVEANSVLVQITEPFRQTTPEEMDRLLKELTDYLSQAGIPGRSRCYHCERPDPDLRVEIGGLVTLIHTDCYNKMTEEVDRSRREYASEEKNYGTGAIGAILGGLVAAIPWVAVELLLSRLAAVLGYLIGVGAFKGYQVLRGKTGPATRWIVGTATLVSVLSAEFATVVIIMLKEGLPVNDFTLRALFGNSEFLGTWLRDLGLGLFLALLGILPLFASLKGGAKAVFADVKKLDA